MQKYYDKFYKKNDLDGFCCICGKETHYVNFTDGYRMTCSKKCWTTRHTKVVWPSLKSKMNGYEAGTYNHSKETRNLLSKSLTGRKVWNAGLTVEDERVRKSVDVLLASIIGNPLSNEHRNKISKGVRLAHIKGKFSGNDTKLKQRNSAINRIENRNGQVIPNYNPEACKIIEQYGKEHGYNFQHAENGGEYHIKELGYFVDGYDKEKNVVIEYDEKSHFNENGKLKSKDVNRQTEIIEYLKCNFIRIKYNGEI
ncbi:hypothetical protein H8D04_00400 [bacterium]|nr:hypothetical protein [bacterium]